MLKHYAVHYKTGEPIPQSLVDKIKNAGTFNQGYSLTELLAAASLDMQWHTIKDTSAVSNVDAFEKAALKTTGLALPTSTATLPLSYSEHPE